MSVSTQTLNSTMHTVTVVIVQDYTPTHTLVLDRTKRYIWNSMLQDIRSGHHTVASSGIMAFVAE